MMPCFESSSRNVVATDTESNTASTATPVRRFRSSIGIPSFSNEEQLGVHLLQVLQLGTLLRGRVVADRLVVDGAVLHVRPMGLGHLHPVAVRLEAPVEHPFRLALLRRDEPDDVLAQARGNDLGLDVGDEPVLVGLQDLRFDARTHGHSPGGRAPKVIAYSHALQPLVMWVRRSTAAPKTSRRNCSSAAHTSGNRSATARDRKSTRLNSSH